MSTRGLIGFRTNNQYKVGYFNHWDSYYTNLGYAIVNAYFNGEDIKDLIEDKERNEDSGFILDGLFCEYAYVYNEENDTLEVYRGFFPNPQFKGHHKSGQYYTHLIMVIDKKKHKIEEVLLAFKQYDTREWEEEDIQDEQKRDYFFELTKDENVLKTISKFEKKWLEDNKQDYENRLALEELEGKASKYPEQRIIPLEWNKDCEVCLK